MDRLSNVLPKLLVLVVPVVILTQAPLASAGSLSIEPIREELSLKAGQSIENQLIVRNSTDKPISVSLEAESFSVINESYDYSFSKAEDLKSWVRFNETSAPLAGKGSHLFTYTVSAPQNAEPGGKYIAIFSTTDNESSAAITSLERAGTLLYITIPGGITKQGNVVDVTVAPLNARRQTSAKGRIRNTGSTHFKSRITTEVHTVFGGFVSRSQGEHLLLPNTVRSVDEPVILGKFPGPYRVKVTIGLGDSPAYSITKWAWYLPIVPTVFLAIVCVILAKQLARWIHKSQKS